MPDFLINYIESNIVCVIIFAIMLLHDHSTMDKQEKQIKFDGALISFILYFLSDSVWAIVYAGAIPKNIYTAAIVNFVNYIIMAYVTYSWLRYVMATEKIPNRDRKINKFAIIFPLLVISVAMVVVYFISPALLIDANFDPTPLYYGFQVLPPAIYIVAVMVYTLKKALAETNPIAKKKHFYIGCFPLFLVLCGLVQVVFLPTIAVFCFGCAIFMLIFYIQSMEKQISMDPLTRLNNRGQLMRYISHDVNIHKDGPRICVIMIDINDFKFINDNFGHAEGDRALIIVAGTLKKIANARSMPSFLGRYGGDEFIFIAHTNDENEIEKMISEIRSQIDSESVAEDTPYTISVGIGYDFVLGEHDSFEKCIQRADHKLYLDKEYCKLNGNSSSAR